MTRLDDLIAHGQSLWLDYIRRAYLDSGEMQASIDSGIRGVTSNPSIFEKAIAGSSDYDHAIRELAGSDLTDEALYETLALEDIGRAADLFRPLYDESGGRDGFVSLEVSPALAHDTEATIGAARRLWKALDRPNIMIKVPATDAGLPAIQTLIGDGININITLIFSVDNYVDVVHAYMTGLENAAARGMDISRIASVASFFISRVDSAVDKLLEEKGNSALQGKTAVANAKVAYERFEQLFGDPDWTALAQSGGRVQRPLWGSTSTKNPAYPDTLYVDELIGPFTVNTAPQETIEAFIDHGTVANTITEDVADAHAQLAALAALGIDLETVTDQLQADGVASFAAAFDSLLASVASKRARLGGSHAAVEAHLGAHADAVAAALAQLQANDIMARIWDHDHTVWRPDPDEISNRLGWLHAPETMAANVARLDAFAASVRDAGYTQVVLLGMGGSSLAPEVFRETFNAREGHPELLICDSTDPDALAALRAGLDLSRTLFVVATKSGGTVETLSFFKLFYNEVVAELGAEAAGDHFVAITDPGSKLEKLAADYQFRDTFLNDPNVGGRYSALTYFGLVPAALLGIDLTRLLERAAAAGTASKAANSEAAQLGAILGALANEGIDKVTFMIAPDLVSLGDWIEQLIAESTGKEGKGILPVVGEPVSAPAGYGDDRLFVHIGFEGETESEALDAVRESGAPFVSLHLDDRYDLGSQFMLWEMATVVAGHLLDIQPFDQPDVEAAKVLARQMVETYSETGELPDGASQPAAAEALREFVAQSKDGDYIALQAYVQPTEATDAALHALRQTLLEQTGRATTVGYGPRFLHSTGQLHKGDGGSGLFIQLTADNEADIAIPDTAGQAESSMSFGVLIAAQALGDAEALREAGRRVLRLDLGRDPAAAIDALAGNLTG